MDNNNNRMNSSISAAKSLKTTHNWATTQPHQMWKFIIHKWQGPTATQTPLVTSVLYTSGRKCMVLVVRCCTAKCSLFNNIIIAVCFKMTSISSIVNNHKNKNGILWYKILWLSYEQNKCSGRTRSHHTLGKSSFWLWWWYLFSYHPGQIKGH